MRPKTYDEFMQITNIILDQMGASVLCRKGIAQCLMERFSYSERCICELLDVSSCALNYKNVEKADGYISDRIRDIKNKFPHYGYRRIHSQLAREGLHINLKKVYRLYSELDNKTSPRIELKPLRSSSSYNEIWAMDYLECLDESGNKIQIVSVIDEATRQCKFCRAFEGVNSELVIIYMVELLKTESVHPKKIVTDNGSVFTSSSWNHFFGDNNIVHFLIPKGTPQMNGYIERYNRTLREEFLQYFCITNVDALNRFLSQWVNWYNGGRPHSALDYLTPNEYARKITSSVLTDLGETQDDCKTDNEKKAIVAAKKRTA